jgi:hypothetical protein
MHRRKRSQRPPKWVAILIALVGAVIILASIYGYVMMSH